VEPAPQSAPPDVADFPALKLRPVSTVFSAQFSEIIPRDSLSSNETNLDTPASPSLVKVFSPTLATPSSTTRSEFPRSEFLRNDDQKAIENQTLLLELQQQILTERSQSLAHQRYRLELEGRVMELEAQLAELHALPNSTSGYCNACGRGGLPIEPCRDRLAKHSETVDGKQTSVLHRPRARTATSPRFGSDVP